MKLTLRNMNVLFIRGEGGMGRWGFGSAHPLTSATGLAMRDLRQAASKRNVLEASMFCKMLLRI